MQLQACLNTVEGMNIYLGLYTPNERLEFDPSQFTDEPEIRIAQESLRKTMTMLKMFEFYEEWFTKTRLVRQLHLAGGEKEILWENPYTSKLEKHPIIMKHLRELKNTGKVNIAAITSIFVPGVC